MNIYISDLDGTLLNEDGQLSSKDYADLNLFYEKKIFFSIATARSIVTIKETLDSGLKDSSISTLQFHLPIIEYNGAYVTDYNTKTVLSTEAIEKDILKKLFEESKRLNIAQIVGGNDTSKEDFDTRYFCHISEINHKGLEDFHEDRQRANDKRLTFSQDVLAENNQVVGLTFIDTKENLQPLMEFIDTHYSEKLNQYLLQDQYKDRRWFWLLVQAKNATKGNGIKKILQLKKLKDYYLSVFGDNINDVEMFNLADKSLAPTNAVDEIKQIADDIIGHHNESAVIQYIKKKEGLTPLFKCFFIFLFQFGTRLVYGWHMKK